MTSESGTRTTTKRQQHQKRGVRLLHTGSREERHSDRTHKC